MRFAHIVWSTLLLPATAAMAADNVSQDTPAPRHKGSHCSRSQSDVREERRLQFLPQPLAAAQAFARSGRADGRHAHTASPELSEQTTERYLDISRRRRRRLLGRPTGGRWRINGLMNASCPRSTSSKGCRIRPATGTAVAIDVRRSRSTISRRRRT
jgi:hypothetical protein